MLNIDGQDIRNIKRGTDPSIDEAREDNLERGINFVLVLFGFVAFGILITTLNAAGIKLRDDPDPTGIGTAEFGDAFGFATSVFTGLAFAGLLFTMHLQRRELSLVREERAIAQKTFDATKRALESQIEAAKAQLKASHENTRAAERERHEARVIRLLDHPSLSIAPSDPTSSKHLSEADLVFAEALEKLSPSNIKPGQPLGRNLHFVEPVALPKSGVSLWLTAWDSIEKSRQYWLRSLLDEKTGSQFNHVLIWHYFDRLMKVGSTERRQYLLGHYEQHACRVFGFPYPTLNHLKSIEEAICQSHLQRLQTHPISIRAQGSKKRAQNKP